MDKECNFHYSASTEATMLFDTNESIPSIDLSSFSSDGSQSTLCSDFSEQTFNATNVDILSIVKCANPPALPLKMAFKSDGFEVVRTKENTGMKESRRKLHKERAALKIRADKKSNPTQSALSYDTYAAAYLKERKKRKKLISRKYRKARSLNLKLESHSEDDRLVNEVAKDKMKDEHSSCENLLDQALKTSSPSPPAIDISRRGLEETLQTDKCKEKKYKITYKYEKKRKSPSDVKDKRFRRERDMKQVMRSSTIFINRPLQTNIFKELQDNSRSKLKDAMKTPLAWLEDLQRVPLLKSSCCQDFPEEASVINVRTIDTMNSDAKYNLQSMSDSLTPSKFDSQSRLSNSTSFKSNTDKSQSLIDHSFSTTNGSTRSFRMKSISREFLRQRAEEIVSQASKQQSREEDTVDSIPMKEMSVQEREEPESLRTGNENEDKRYSASLRQHNSSKETQLRSNLELTQSETIELKSSLDTNEPFLMTGQPKFIAGENTYFNRAIVTNSSIATDSIHENQIDNCLITFSSNAHSQDSQISYDDYDDRDSRMSSRYSKGSRQISFDALEPFTTVFEALPSTN
jgi:hypothetical protein